MSGHVLRAAAILFLLIPTLAYDGYFLLGILSKRYPINFDEYPKVSALSYMWQILLCLTFPIATLLLSGGFFAGAFPLDKKRTTPSRWIRLVYLGAILMVFSCIVLAIGLFQSL